jgi:type IV pilus assembly protein PilC
MEFLCRLGTPEGRVIEEVHESSDLESLRGALERRGFHIFSVERRGFAFTPRLPALRRRRRVKGRQFLVFNQELAALLRAGLPLLQSLDLRVSRPVSGRASSRASSAVSSATSSSCSRRGARRSRRWCTPPC